MTVVTRSVEKSIQKMLPSKWGAIIDRLSKKLYLFILKCYFSCLLTKGNKMWIQSKKCTNGFFVRAIYFFFTQYRTIYLIYLLLASNKMNIYFKITCIFYTPDYRGYKVGHKNSLKCSNTWILSDYPFFSAKTPLYRQKRPSQHYDVVECM